MDNTATGTHQRIPIQFFYALFHKIIFFNQRIFEVKKIKKPGAIAGAICAYKIRLIHRIFP
jgi:hypothetical protein